MDASTIQSLVGSLGFPIVCCGLLFWQQNKTMSDFAARIESSITKLTQSTDENTKATTTLVATVETIAKVGDTKHGV